MKSKKKKKGIAIASILILAIVGTAGGLFYYKSKPKTEEKKSFLLEEDFDYKITILFDSTGGSFVDKIIVQANEEITLPGTTREGYKFLGWFNGEQELEEKAKFTDDVTLVAKWESIQSDDKSYRVTYDTNGGNYIKSQLVECDKALTFPTNPTKDGYTFKGWKDKSGKTINNGDKLKCEDIVLYAEWKKVDTKGKKYTCPTGYKLEGDKCTIEGTSTVKCPDGTNVYSGGCVTLTSKVRKEPNRKCGKKTVNTGNGQTQSIRGELFNLGYYACYYGVVSSASEQESMEDCSANGHKWNTKNNKCYYDSDAANVNITYSCSDSTNYIYIASPSSIIKKSKLSAGCYPFSKPQTTCAKDYNLVNDKCIKTIDATEKK